MITFRSRFGPTLVRGGFRCPVTGTAGSEPASAANIAVMSLDEDLLGVIRRWNDPNLRVSVTT